MIISEIIPNIYLSDGYNFIEGFFTKDALKEFRSLYSHVKFSSLRDKIIYVNRWTLEMRQAPSNEFYTSYQNFTINFIVESFRPILHERPAGRNLTKIEPIFNVDEISTLFRAKRH